MSANCPTCLSRRHLFAAGGAATALTLTGCSVYGDESVAPASVAAPPTTGASEPGSSPAAPRALAQLDDVPEGGGLILADAGLVLTRPSGDTVKAFSSTCTHQGCAVSAVTGGKITCPCHGSAFAVADGSVLNGPATRPLAARSVTVVDGAITLA